ncbi:MAG: YceI family protein [Gammaproteobacteria bacterium]|nr:YceI family protein [Gammaproteobacteria bacterium]NKB63185.1 YceI family protein [Gammaproteobacteria bacterium]
MVFVIVVSTMNVPGHADKYVIDDEGKHAFIQFKVSHLGYSYVIGTFPDFEGVIDYDSANPSNASVQIDIDTTTADSSHAARNRHIRSADFLDVANFPSATFTSTSYIEQGDGTGTLVGDLTLHGVTKSIEIKTNKIGEGKDPWGKYRIGFDGNTTITMADFGINYNLGPASRTVDLYLIVEGIRQ